MERACTSAIWSCKQVSMFVFLPIIITFVHVCTHTGVRVYIQSVLSSLLFTVPLNIMLLIIENVCA